jgi:hypothetical protein
VVEFLVLQRERECRLDIIAADGLEGLICRATTLNEESGKLGRNNRVIL